MRSAKHDIRTVESWGYSPHEALEFVARRAVAEAQRVAQETPEPPDRDVLEQHLGYLGELRAICLASLSHRTAVAASA